jgi:hypothetical protein
LAGEIKDIAARVQKGLLSRSSPWWGVEITKSSSVGRALSCRVRVIGVRAESRREFLSAGRRLLFEAAASAGSSSPVRRSRHSRILSKSNLFQLENPMVVLGVGPGIQDWVGRRRTGSRCVLIQQLPFRGVPHLSDEATSHMTPGIRVSLDMTKEQLFFNLMRGPARGEPTMSILGFCSPHSLILNI